jgi:hypothetical protein
MPPPQQALILASLCALIIALPVFFLISAAFLRLACSISGVIAPGFGKAMSITFVADGVSTAGAFFLVYVLTSTNQGNVDAKTLGLIANAVGVPLGAVMSAAIYSGMLPTSFGKGILIWLVQLLMVIGIGVAFTAAFFAISATR